MLHGGHLNLAPFHGQVHILILIRAVNRNLYRRAFLALDIVIHQHIQALRGNHGFPHLIDDVPGLHACFQGRRSFKHLYDGTKAGGAVLADHGADT